MNPPLPRSLPVKTRTIGVAALTALLSETAFSAGFFLPNQSTEATARGNAWVATADSAAAVYYNPAGLTQLSTATAEAGLYMPYLGVEMKSSLDGNTYKADKGLQFAPSLFAAVPTKGPWAFGFGMYVPFGLASKWGQDTPFRRVTTEAELVQLRFSTVASYQLTESLSLGAGLSLDYADTTLKQGIGFVDGDEMSFSGDGNALNWLVGLLWKPHEQHSVGLVYRSAAEFTLKGNVSSSPGLPGFPSGGAHVDFNTPASAAVGYAYKPNDRLTIEANIEWIDWDSFNTLTLAGPGMPMPMPVPFEYKSNFIYEIGMSYRIDDRWTVHAGYDYNQGSPNNPFFNPAVSDMDLQYLTTGVNYNVNQNLTLQLGYQFGWGEEDIVSEVIPLVDGTYKSRHHNFMLSARWNF